LPIFEKKRPHHLLNGNLFPQRKGMNLSPVSIEGLDVTLSVPKCTASELRHFLQRGDARRPRVDGVCFGKMCAELGLQAGTPISDDAFDALARFQHPVKKNELASQRKLGSPFAFLYTFHGAKTKSELPTTGYNPLLVGEHERAVAKTMEQWEFQTFIETGIHVVYTGRMVGAAFLHAAWTPFEERFTAEVVVFNLSGTEAGSSYSPLSLVEPNNEIDRLKEYYSLRYANEIFALQHEFNANLNLRSERVPC
jgi:hypothetical protein